MIWHKTVAPYLHLMLAAPFGHKFHVRNVVPLVEEGLLSAVAALRYVMRQAGNHDSCLSSHAANLAGSTNPVNNKVCVPGTLSVCPRNFFGTFSRNFPRNFRFSG